MPRPMEPIVLSRPTSVAGDTRRLRSRSITMILYIRLEELLLKRAEEIKGISLDSADEPVPAIAWMEMGNDFLKRSCLSLASSQDSVPMFQIRALDIMIDPKEFAASHGGAMYNSELSRITPGLNKYSCWVPNIAM